MGGKGLHALESVLVNDDDLAGLDVADELGVDEIEGAGFAGQHPGITDLPDCERPEAMRIADANQLVLRHDDERIGPLNATHGGQQGTFTPRSIRLGHEVEDDLAVHRGLKDGALGLEFLAEQRGIGEVAVVGHGDLASGAIHRERLGVADVRRTRGGIAGMPHRHVPDQAVQDIALEDLGHQAHALVLAELAAVAGDDAGTFLATVLEGVEAEVGELSRVRVAKNPKDAAVMFGVGG